MIENKVNPGDLETQRNRETVKVIAQCRLSCCVFCSTNSVTNENLSIAVNLTSY